MIFTFSKLINLWDVSDDCCERRCTHDHPCEAGDGHCVDDSDCVGSRNMCGLRSCKNETFLPKFMYGINYVEGWYEDDESCCYQSCHTDTDCLVETQKCDTKGSVKKCVTDPCKVNKESKYKAGRYGWCYGSADKEIYYCRTGYNSFVPYEGCSDEDECQSSDKNLCNGTVNVTGVFYDEICVNTIGSYACYYSEGTRGIGWGSASLTNIELPVSWKILIYDQNLEYLAKNRKEDVQCYYGEDMQPQVYSDLKIKTAHRVNMADGHVMCGGYYHYPRNNKTYIKYINHCYKYISLDKKWVQIESMLHNRNSFQMVLLRDKLYAIGGGIFINSKFITLG